MNDRAEDELGDLTKPPYGTMVRGQFVSVRDVEDFMAAVFTKKACPWCESEEWDLIVRATDLDVAAEDGYVVLTTEHYVGDGKEDGIVARTPSPAFTYPMFLVICDSCGFTRTHSMMSYLRWKDRQSEKESSVSRQEGE
jgi:hypothetical protein